MTTLAIQDLTITIEERTLVDRLSVEVHENQVWGMLGSNGAGKTTLLHTIAGLRKNQTGTIQLNNKDIFQINAKRRAKKIGLLQQDGEFSFPSTVLETALIGRYPHQKNWFYDEKKDIEFAKQILAEVGLSQFEHRTVTNLSGGEKRKLMLAILLIQNPDIYLLDEPTNHLDMQQRVQMLARLTKLARQQHKIVIMILHDVHLISHFCDHIILFEEPGKIRTGECQDILNKATLHRLFPIYMKENCINL